MWLARFRATFAKLESSSIIRACLCRAKRRTSREYYSIFLMKSLRTATPLHVAFHFTLFLLFPSIRFSWNRYVCLFCFGSLFSVKILCSTFRVFQAWCYVSNKYTYTGFGELLKDLSYFDKK